MTKTDKTVPVTIKPQSLFTVVAQTADGQHNFEDVMDRISAIFTTADKFKKQSDIYVSIVPNASCHIVMSEDKKQFNVTIPEEMTKPEAAMILGMIAAESYKNTAYNLVSKKVSKDEASEMLNKRWKLIETQLDSIHLAVTSEAKNAPGVVDAMDKLIGRGGEQIATSHTQLNSLVNDLNREFHAVTGEHLNKQAISSIVATLMMRSDVFTKITYLSRDNVYVPSEFLSRLMAEDTVKNHSGEVSVNALAVGGVFAHLMELETGETCDINKEWIPSDDEFNNLLSYHSELSVSKTPGRNPGML